jgi:hypothetical protein
VVDWTAALRGSTTQLEAAAGAVRINRADEKRATLQARVRVSRRSSGAERRNGT